MSYVDRETLIYPDVLASTKPADAGAGRFTEALTNNQDTVLRTYIYWYIPPDGGEPVLIFEIDDEDTGPEVMDIKIRVRRNDGLLYEGSRSTQENLDETED